MMHPINEFYLGLRKTTAFDYALEDLWALPHSIISVQYFYIEWLFPVDHASKWNKTVPTLHGDDLLFFQSNLEIQQKFLTSFDKIMHHFGIERIGNQVFATDALKARDYWLKEVGHQEKKISRIMRSLAWCGQLDLAKNLQSLALRLIVQKGHLKPNTLYIWQHLLDDLQGDLGENARPVHLMTP